MKDDVAIKVDGVYKDFKLPHDQRNSLKSLFMNIGRKRDKGFEVQHALRDISFEVKKGEFFGIVGRNGSGKSTLLKIIAEIYRPTKGKVTKSGRLVPFIELGVGFNPELTGRENVFLNGALLGFSKSEVEAMYDDIVAFAELEKFMDQKLKNYSSGMQVRLAFSVATRANAEILLIDEVLAVGDADFQRKCYEYFKTLKRDNTTVVFISHDMTAVRQFCDRAVLINDGKIQQEGDVEKVAESYSKLFIDDSEKSVKGSDNRWGQQTGVILAPKVSLDEKNITLSAKLKVSNEIEEPVLGFVLKDSMGQSVFGSNTKLLSKNMNTLSSNQPIEIEFKFQNILSDGQYTLDLALIGSDNATVYDWWNQAYSINVKRAIFSPYSVYVDIKFSYKET